MLVKWSHKNITCQLFKVSFSHEGAVVGDGGAQGLLSERPVHVDAKPGIGRIIGANSS